MAAKASSPPSSGSLEFLGDQLPVAISTSVGENTDRKVLKAECDSKIFNFVFFAKRPARNAYLFSQYIE